MLRVHTQLLLHLPQEQLRIVAVATLLQTFLLRFHPEKSKKRQTLVGYGRELHGIPELRQSPNQAVFLPLLAAGIEVVGAEVLIQGPVLELPTAVLARYPRGLRAFHYRSSHGQTSNPHHHRRWPQTNNYRCWHSRPQ